MAEVNYNTRELQLRLLDILVEFDKVCKAHGIDYYMLFGTMLGAVRHKGFIPWDDDIDVGVPRPQYELLVKHAKDWFQDPFNLRSFESDRSFLFGFAKLEDTRTTLVERIRPKSKIGIYIDVFPIDGISKNSFMQHVQDQLYSLYYRICYFLRHEPYERCYRPKTWWPIVLRKCCSAESAMRRFKRVTTMYPYDNSTWVASLHDGLNSAMPKTVLGVPTPIEFEGHMFYGVENTDDYLTREYGDYMKIPKEEDRQIHSFLKVDFNKSFRED